MYLLTLMIITVLLPLIVVLGGIKRGMLPYAVILQSVLFLGFSLVMLFGFAWSTGEPLGASILKEINITVKTIVETPDLLKIMGLEGIEKAEASDILIKAYSFMINMLPSYILCWGMAFSYFDYLIISAIKKRMGKEVLMLPPFANFSLPRKALYGSLLIYGLSWLTVSLKIIPAEALLLNVQGLILFIFAVQGLAVSIYTIRKRNVPKIIGWIVCITLFFSAFGKVFLAGLGIFDLLMGIRQKLEKQ